MKIKAVISLLLGGFFGMIFSGCSYLTVFYIQNLSNIPQIIKINYNYPVSKAIKNEPESFSFNYENGILTPRAFQKIKNLKSLEKIEVRDSAIVLKIYPNSTTRIDKSHNGRWRYMIKSVGIDGKIFNPDELRNKTKLISNDYILKIE